MANRPAGRITPPPPARRAPLVAPARHAPNQPGVLEPKAPPRMAPGPIRVKAIAMGYYDHCRRRVGDVFTIANERAFSRVWMERVDPTTRGRLTTSPQALRQAHDEILGGKVVSRDAVEPTGTEDVFNEK